MNEQTMDWKKLTEKYYAGETSLEEEAALRAYWQKQPAGGPEVTLSHYFAARRKETLPAATSQQIAEQTRRQPTVLRRLGPWAIAATILGLALALNLLQNVADQSLDGAFPLEVTAQKAPVDWSKYEVTDPEAAAAILVSSLRTVSGEFEQASTAVRTVGKLRNLRKPIN